MTFIQAYGVPAVIVTVLLVTAVVMGCKVMERVTRFFATIP